VISYAQAGQDLFVWEMTEHKHGGFFLDVGCNDPVKHSNTYALELEGWTGLMVDVVDGCETRKGTFVKCDAGKPDDRLKFQYSHMPDVCDYASIDVDDNLESVLPHIPWDKHAFRVLTVETDVYVRGFRPRQFARQLLRSLGYALVCGDVRVIPPGRETWECFEDFWVNPQLVNPELVTRYTCNGKPWPDVLKL
jgi:hypothetical protein